MRSKWLNIGQKNNHLDTSKWLLGWVDGWVTSSQLTFKPCHILKPFVLTFNFPIDLVAL